MELLLLPQDIWREILIESTGTSVASIVSMDSATINKKIRKTIVLPMIKDIVVKLA